MRKIRYGLTVFAVGVGLLWAGIAGAQPGPPADLGPPFPIPMGGLQNFAPVPQTGQTMTFAAGDDGVVQAGVVPPDPRFTANLDGTITDNLTGLRCKA